MCVSLSPLYQQFIRRCLDSGRYRNQSEVMRAALKLLQEDELVFLDGSTVGPIER